MSSKFYFGSNSSTSSVNRSSDDDDPSTLPYPKALPRSDFLAPNFSAQDYLSSLGNRHQTLEDLRSELRSRSQLLNKELLDLVNTHYQDFLNLGSSVKGGDEKIEELRVGLLGFRKEIEGVRKAVIEREVMVDGLLREREQMRREIAVGRRMLDLEKRVGRLEGKLMLASAGKSTGEATSTDNEASDSDSDVVYENDEDEAEEDTSGEMDGTTSIPIGKLRLRVDELRQIKQMTRQIGFEHAFVVSLQERIMRSRATLLLDLGAALKQAKTAGNAGVDRLMKILAMYRDLDEAKEASIALRSLK